MGLQELRVLFLRQEGNMEDFVCHTESQGTEGSDADPKLVGSKTNQLELHIENQMPQVFQCTVLKNFSTCPIVPQRGSYWMPFLFANCEFFH